MTKLDHARQWRTEFRMRHFTIRHFTIQPRLILLAAALIALVTLSGCQKLRARDNLNRGVQAFKATKYSDAVEYFKKAVDLDPDFPTARLYLATAYMSQYIPGADSPENKQYAQSAMEQFTKVLAANPSDLLATQSIANIYFQQKDWDKSEEWNRKVVTLDPNNKEAYYILGVIPWARFLQVDRQARVDMAMKPEDPGPLKDKKVRADLKEQWMPKLEIGSAAC